MANLSPTQITALKTKLYDACLPLVQEDPKRYFNQAAIFDLNIIPNNDVQILLKVTQALVNEKLFKILQSDGLAWQLRTQDEARKYRTLKPEHEIVYSLIDEAGAEGIWSKTIKARSNLHDAVFRAAVKALESKQLISDMKSVEHMNRKMYIKSSLQPSNRATGGSWFTDGVLDESFIETIMTLLYRYVKKRSWYLARDPGGRRRPKKALKGARPEGPREKALSAPEIEEGSNRRDAARLDYERMLPLPAGYADYPTLDEMTAFILNTGATKDCTLTAEEVQQLLDVLVYDGKIERLIGGGGDGFAYKAVRKTFLDEDEQMDSVLTEAPCGRCPVFDLCEEGGPVGPSNCEYFAEWLSL